MVHHARPAPAQHKHATPSTSAKPTAAADPATVAAAPINAVRTAAIAPLKAVHVSAGNGKSLLLAGLALLLVALASGSMLRLLVQLNKPRRGW